MRMDARFFGHRYPSDGAAGNVERYIEPRFRGRRRDRKKLGERRGMGSKASH